MLKWHNKSAIKIHKQMLSLFGPPVGVITAPGGLSLWNKKSLQGCRLFNAKNVFVEHLVRDEKIRHLCPKKHNDFFYSSINVDISPKSSGKSTSDTTLRVESFVDSSSNVESVSTTTSKVETFVDSSSNVESISTTTSNQL